MEIKKKDDGKLIIDGLGIEYYCYGDNPLLSIDCNENIGTIRNFHITMIDNYNWKQKIKLLYRISKTLFRLPIRKSNAVAFHIETANLTFNED